VHLNSHVVVGHDTALGDCVSANPNATISGECAVEDRVLVGAGAVVLQGRRVGREAVIGAAACVTRDVTPRDVCVGVPAHPLDGGRSL
jgi:acetyltransferase-like isoleucine patch superfamily enzyme